MDNRIGIRTPDSITWPERSISGRAYRRPCTTIGIGGGHFVVVDNFPMEGYLEEMVKLREAIAHMNAPPKSSVKAKVADDTDA